jgi:hypothetical protein
MIRNLGQVLTILTKAQVNEGIMHMDVDAWGAPSECHSAVSKGEAKRLRIARKHAEALAGAPLRVIEREARKRGGHRAMLGFPYGRLYAILDSKMNPFYPR